MMDVMDLGLSLMEWTAGMSSHRVSYAYESSKWPSLRIHFREHRAVPYSVGPRALDFPRPLPLTMTHGIIPLEAKGTSYICNCSIPHLLNAYTCSTNFKL